MRIYLACTVRGDRNGTSAGRIICERLQQHGHDVLTTHLLADDVESAEAKLTEQDIFERDLRWLSTCEVLVAEASGSSYGVGFEVGYVLGRAPHTGQRVVLFYNAGRRAAISRLIVGNRHAACTTVPYETCDELPSLVDIHVTGVRSGRQSCAESPA